jgi:glycosyltransferase involved in cell wall biosynthesis
MMTGTRTASVMFSIIIPTTDSERALVPTLAALVPGATAGIVREVIVADSGSNDETEMVADVAGCVFLKSNKPLGTRLQEAARTARSDWLMFIRPGAVPGFTWVDETMAFSDRRNSDVRAAVFSPRYRFFGELRSRMFLPSPDQGLMLRKSFYDHLGGHRADTRDPEAGLISRIGRLRLVRLRTVLAFPDI